MILPKEILDTLPDCQFKKDLLSGKACLCSHEYNKKHMVANWNGISVTGLLIVLLEFTAHKTLKMCSLPIDKRLMSV